MPVAAGAASAAGAGAGAAAAGFAAFLGAAFFAGLAFLAGRLAAFLALDFLAGAFLAFAAFDAFFAFFFFFAAMSFTPWFFKSHKKTLRVFAPMRERNVRSGSHFLSSTILIVPRAPAAPSTMMRRGRAGCRCDVRCGRDRPVRWASRCEAR